MPNVTRKSVLVHSKIYFLSDVRIRLLVLTICIWMSFSSLSATSSLAKESNPLVNLTIFTFIPVLDDFSSETHPCVETLIDQLSSFADVRRIDPLHFTDWTILSGLPCLHFHLEPVIDVEGHELELIQGVLRLQCAVNIVKSRAFASPFIWARNAFFKGKLRKKRMKAAEVILDMLMEQFMIDYQEANPGASRPLIYVVFT